jgi:tricorn protease-like protein
VHFVSISDNGKAVFGVNNNPEVLVYDFLNENKIFEGEIYPLSSSFKISSDGKYFYCSEIRFLKYKQIQFYWLRNLQMQYSTAVFLIFI